MRNESLPVSAATCLTIALVLSGCAGTVDVTSNRVDVGDDFVELRESRSGIDGHWFVNLHDDENTSVISALWYIRHRSGSILELVHSGQRNLEYTIDGVDYRIDPNRIYTEAGIRATLERLGELSPDAVEAAAAVASGVTKRISAASPKWVIALHNNSEDSYSLNSYLPGGPFLADAAAIHRNHEMDPDDFFFVTDEDLYFALARRNLNVVLQDNTKVTDDGSLSVYSARLGLRYVNVEAQHGHLREQKRMISKLMPILDELE